MSATSAPSHVHQADRTPDDRTAGRRRLRFGLMLGGALAIVVLSLVVGAALGALRVSPVSMIGVVSTPRAEWTLPQTVFIEVRLPRVLTAAAIGAGLALSGLVLQIVLRNPLAEPYLVGISSGASLGAVSVILYGTAVAVAPVALLTGLVALAFTLVLGSLGGRGRTDAVILAGVAVSALFSALTSLLIIWAPQADSYRQVMFWMVGSLASASWTSVVITAVTLVVVGGAVLSLHRLVEVFLLDDVEIVTLGVPVRASRALLLVLSALLAAGMVSVSGAIGFVGLIVPHLVRRVVPTGVGRQAALSLPLGAILLVLADTGARTIALPQELPVGIATSVLGAGAMGVILAAGRRSRRA